MKRVETQYGDSLFTPETFDDLVAGVRGTICDGERVNLGNLQANSGIGFRLWIEEIARLREEVSSLHAIIGSDKTT